MESVLKAIESFSVLLSAADAFQQDLYLQSEEDESLVVSVAAQTRFPTNPQRQRLPVSKKKQTSMDSGFMVSTDFEANFKMSRETFEFLLEKIGPRIGRKEGGGGGRLTVAVDKQILVTTWLLTTNESFKAVGDRFHIHKSVVHASVNRVVSALNELADEFIHWPSDRNLSKVSSHFERVKGIPGVVGIIDAFHVDIRAPVSCSKDFLNQKKVHSVIVMIVCDHRCQLTYVWTGPGASSIAQLYRDSSLHKQCLTDASSKFPNDSHLLGTKAFPLEPWLLTPFPENVEQTPVEINYNISHRTTQAIGMNTVSTMKSRFKKLKSLYLSRIDAVYSTISACCVFHNICLQQKSSRLEMDSYSHWDEVNILEDNEKGRSKREMIAHNLFQQTIE